MNVFTDDNNGADISRTELARKSIEEAGGAAMGADAQFASRSKSERARISEQRQRENMTALQILMLNSEYRERYEATAERLNTIQEDLDDALTENAEALERLRENAVRSASGDLVFQTSTGDLVYADGSEADASEIDIREREMESVSSWEEYQSARNRAAALSNIQSDILDPMHSQMNDQTAPPSMEDLDRFEEDLRRADQLIAQEAISEPAPLSTANRNEQLTQLSFIAEPPSF